MVISGLRRAGKSTILAQLARRLDEDQFYFLNFQDDRFLEFRADDADDLYQRLVEVFGERQTFFLDEVQNVPAGSGSSVGKRIEIRSLAAWLLENS